MANITLLTYCPELFERPMCKIADRCSKPELIEEIHRGIEEGTHFLFCNVECFFVLKPFLENGLPLVQVVMAYAWHSCHALKRYSAIIDDMAAELSAQTLEFWTVRPGFDRVAPRLGWRRHAHRDGFTIWRKPCVTSATH